MDTQRQPEELDPNQEWGTLLENDQISAEEEAFMRGWDTALGDIN